MYISYSGCSNHAPLDNRTSTSNTTTATTTTSTLPSMLLDGGLGENTYKRVYPIGTSPKNSMGYIIPTGHPLTPLVFLCGAVTYGVAKELANILRPLVGYTLPHIKNTEDFVDQVKSLRLREGESITSYDTGGYQLSWMF